MTEEVDNSGPTKLQLDLLIGFGGTIQHGLKAHPLRQHVIYPVGSMLVVEEIITKKQDFLSGHSNTISCVDVSPSGTLIASGQVTFMGFKAEVIIWDFETRLQYCKLVLHRNSVEAVAFTYNSKYLVTLGGQDDGSVVIWNVAAKDAICGSPAQKTSAGITYCLACAKTVDNMFITAGRDTLRVWDVSIENRKLYPVDISINKHKRIIRCLYIDDEDKYVYCGTTTGDIVIINILKRKLRGVLPIEKNRFSCGVTALSQFKSSEFVIGTGDGIVSLCDKNLTRGGSGKEVKLDGAVTSIALRGEWHQFYVGTSVSNIYRFNHVSDFKPQLMTTSNHHPINGVCFPYNCSQLIVTCSYEEIRVWCLKKRQELVRITVPNMTCNAVEVMTDGKSIVSGWSDARIRAFYPESGRLMYMVNQAYGSMVTAIATYHSSRRFVSGSDLGHVVVWDVPDYHRTTTDIDYVTKHFVLKEHKATVTCIKVRNNDSECVTSSIDGSCVIWDLNLRSRRHMLRVNTLFRYVCYHPEEHQVVTTGTDHKLGFWETFDGSMIRELDGSVSGSVNALDISKDGVYLVSGGTDKMVKLWLYEQGEVTHIGIGHSAPITGIAISPDESLIVSVSADGGMLLWKFPTPPPPEPDIMASKDTAIEAAVAKHEDPDDHLLVADNPEKEFEKMSLTKAGVLMPARDKCIAETSCGQTCGNA